MSEKQDVLPWVNQAVIDYEDASFRPTAHYLKVFKGAAEEIEHLRARLLTLEQALRDAREPLECAASYDVEGETAGMKIHARFCADALKKLDAALAASRGRR